MALSLETLKHKFDGAHIYEGVVLNRPHTESAVDAAKVYPFHKTDVIVASYPKSGTTWLQEIAWLLKNNCDFGKARETLLIERSLYLDRYCPDLTDHNERQRNLKSPKVIKTHMRYNTLCNAISKGSPKVLVLMRNPKDVLVSFYHFYRMTISLGNFSGSWDEFFELFKNKELIFGDWHDHVRGWWQGRGHPNYHYVKYEDIKKKPLETVTKIATFLQVSVSQKQLEEIVLHTEFDKIKNNKMVNKEDWIYFDQTISNFIRKGEVGDWKNYFNQDQNDFVDGLSEELKAKGLTFDFE